jgi:hypothetical protein
MKVWLIGSGTMSQSYAAVLKEKGADVQVIGRGAASALLEYGVARILVEKPGALDLSALTALRELANARNAEVLIGYNRRYYSSVRKLKELAAEDGGIVSCLFEFTEWGHEIATLVKGERVKERWLLSNSSHVIDLVFHTIGAPKELMALTSGSLDWHPSSAIFTGAGMSTQGIPFAYHSNWDAPGRWGVEFVTSKRRFFLRPMEALHVMLKGSVAIEQVPVDDTLDRQFKPGLYLQVSDFLEGKTNELCTLDEQIALWPAYCKIASYQP